MFWVFSFARTHNLESPGKVKNYFFLLSSCGDGDHKIRYTNPSIRIMASAVVSIWFFALSSWVC